jgi:hypothetical protein
MKKLKLKFIKKNQPGGGKKRDKEEEIRKRHLKVEKI